MFVQTSLMQLSQSRLRGMSIAVFQQNCFSHENSIKEIEKLQLSILEKLRGQRCHFQLD